MCKYCILFNQRSNIFDGNGQDRKNKLRAAGYDIFEVQNIIDYMLGHPTRHCPETLPADSCLSFKEYIDKIKTQYTH